MTLNRLSLLQFYLLITLLLFLLATIIGAFWTGSKITEAEQNRYRSTRLADQLRQSSDDLTRMVREYVVTGSEQYKNWYFEILAIRDGQQPRPERYDLVYWDLVLSDAERPRGNGEAEPLEELMLAEGYTLEEFRLLEEAKSNSDELVWLETTAMHAVEGLYRDEAGEFTRQAEPNPEFARGLLFDNRYKEAKASIMDPINQFLILLDTRTRQQADSYIRLGHVFHVLTGIFCALALLNAYWMLRVQRRKILSPLSKVQTSTAAVMDGNFDEKINYRSDDEMGDFVDTFNEMLDTTKNSIAALHETNASLEVEKIRSEKLLLNVLPKQIAARMNEGDSIADEFSSVSVLFADLVGFTKLSGRLPPQELVQMLSQIFELFDSRTLEFGIEKIKTIGDCYMAVGGIPEEAVDHDRRVAEFALAILSDFEAWKAGNSYDLDIRIGIHSGTAVAGVVGTQKFAYDIWGDVVNIANRIESTGSPGKIQVSEATFVRLQDTFEFEEVGMVEIKGKSPMRTWNLIKRRFQ